MRLLDEPITKQQKDEMLRSIDGNIFRIYVSDDVEEIVRMLGFATDRLSMLAYSRIKEVTSSNKSVNETEWLNNLLD